MRLDLLLVQRGLAPSRAKAQELIRNSDIEVQRQQTWMVVTSPSQEIDDQQQIRLRSSEILKFVSRGGLKLAAALEHVALDVTGMTVLDVGVSTGGFADCLLQAGAAQVIGIDVGSNQLADRLRGDRRLQLFENLNVRNMAENQAVMSRLASVRLCVIDVSFISLALVLPVVVAALPPHLLLALIKPQFELSAQGLNKSGIVKDIGDLDRATSKVRGVASALGYAIEALFPSALKGGDGNQEFFLFAKKSEEMS